MNYDEFKIRSYTLWDLYLHTDQHPYVGRCYAAAKRADAQNVSQMTVDEASELFGVIVPEWFKTTQKLYKADWPNVAILGNEWRHLHAHLIPRYYTPRIVLGYEFVDQQPNKNYAPYEKKALPKDILLYIKEMIKDN